MNHPISFRPFLLLAAIIALVQTRGILGFLESEAEVFKLDFTNADTIKTKATWSRPERINVTKDGLGWDGDPNSSVEFWLQTTEPIAVGSALRPESFVSIRASIQPPGKFTFEGGTTVFPDGEMYVRFSPDAKHWSTWQCLDFKMPRNRENPQQVYEGLVRVPYRERESYRGLVEKYWETSPASNGDEEDAVRWILKEAPGFFEKTLPFIGYLQFLFETSRFGSHRIKAINIEAYGSEEEGGIESVMVGELRRRKPGPWRFKAP